MNTGIFLTEYENLLSQNQKIRDVYFRYKCLSDVFAEMNEYHNVEMTNELVCLTADLVYHYLSQKFIFPIGMFNLLKIFLSIPDSWDLFINDVIRNEEFWFENIVENFSIDVKNYYYYWCKFFTGCSHQKSQDKYIEMFDDFIEYLRSIKNIYDDYSMEKMICLFDSTCIELTRIIDNKISDRSLENIYEIIANPDTLSTFEKFIFHNMNSVEVFSDKHQTPFKSIPVEINSRINPLYLKDYNKRNIPKYYTQFTMMAGIAINNSDYNIGESKLFNLSPDDFILGVSIEYVKEEYERTHENVSWMFKLPGPSRYRDDWISDESVVGVVRRMELIQLEKILTYINPVDWKMFILNFIEKSIVPNEFGNCFSRYKISRGGRRGYRGRRRR